MPTKKLAAAATETAPPILTVRCNTQAIPLINIGKTRQYHKIATKTAKTKICGSNWVAKMYGGDSDLSSNGS